MGSASVLILGLLVVGYAPLSRRLESSALTPPMLFTAAGLLLGPSVLDALDRNADEHDLEVLAEAALAVLLFTEAATLDLGKVVREAGLPLRLLGVGLPLTMVLGTVVAVIVFPSLEVWEAAALAIVLSPTDAALGQAVVSNPRVPGLIRRSLDVESGLNDGLALPFLTMAIALGETEAGASPDGGWLWFTVRTILVSLAVGAAVGYGGGRLYRWSASAKRMGAGWDRLTLLALAVVSFAAVDLLGGSGFIGAFVAGAVLGTVAPATRRRAEGVGSEEGQLLVLLVFALFGATLVWPAFESLDGQMLLYALLSLTVVRVVPVALSLIGTGLSRATVLYLGWFGPRGTASLVFGIVLVGEAHLSDASLVTRTIVVTVTLSILAHGLSANGGAAAYARAIEALRGRRPPAPELGDAAAAQAAAEP